MSMLPQVEQDLVEAAGRYHGRRRRIRRAAVTAAAAGALAVAGAIALGAVPADDEREVSAGQPSPVSSDPAALARAAGCTLRHPRVDGSDHVARAFRPGDYPTNPAAGGDHSPEVAADGIHPPGRTPALGRLVHSLEHGRVHLQYAPGASARIVGDLVGLFEETGGRHLLLFESAAGMQAPVALTAWGHVLTCDDTSTGALEAMRAFRDAYVDKGPELVP